VEGHTVSIGSAGQACNELQTRRNRRFLRSSCDTSKNAGRHGAIYLQERVSDGGIDRSFERLQRGDVLDGGGEVVESGGEAGDKASCPVVRVGQAGLGGHEDSGSRAGGSRSGGQLSSWTQVKHSTGGSAVEETVQ